MCSFSHNNHLWIYKWPLRRKSISDNGCPNFSENISLCPSEFRIGIRTKSESRNYGFRLAPLKGTPATPASWSEHFSYQRPTPGRDKATGDPPRHLPADQNISSYQRPTPGRDESVDNPPRHLPSDQDIVSLISNCKSKLCWQMAYHRIYPCAAADATQPLVISHREHRPRRVISTYFTPLMSL